MPAREVSGRAACAVSRTSSATAVVATIVGGLEAAPVDESRGKHLKCGNKSGGLDEVNKSHDEVAGVEAPGQDPPRDIDLRAADLPFRERTDILHDGALSTEEVHPVWVPADSR